MKKILVWFFKKRGEENLQANFKAVYYLNKIISPFRVLRGNIQKLVYGFFLLLVLPLGIYLYSLFASDTSLINELLDKNSGNLLAELYGGYIFLIVAIYFQRHNDKRISELHEDLRYIKMERDYQRMMDFLEKGDHYDVSLENHLRSDGVPLTYNISPARNKDGSPVTYYDGLRDRYVLKVNDISHRSVLKKSELEDYMSSPISPNEYYFISFANGKWCFSDLDGENRLEPFDWTGKVGNCSSRPSANEVLNVHSNFENLSAFTYNQNGERSQSGTQAILWSDSDGNYYVSPTREAFPKKIFTTYPSQDYMKEKPYLKIAYIEGYFQNIDSLNNFKSLIQEVLIENNIILPELEWWKGERISGT